MRIYKKNAFENIRTNTRLVALTDESIPSDVIEYD